MPRFDTIHAESCYVKFRTKFRTRLRYGSYMPSTGNPEGKTTKDNLKVDHG